VRKPRVKQPQLKSRSMRWLEKQGYVVADTEKTIQWPGGMVKRDLFGFGDILAFKWNQGFPFAKVPLMVNATDETSVAHKITAIQTRPPPLLVKWLRVGYEAEIHGWLRPTTTIRTWRLRRVGLYPGENGTISVVGIETGPP